MGYSKGNLKAAKLAGKAVGMHGDGNGLYLRVAPGGSRQWIQRITINGRRKEIGLGGLASVSLAQARMKSAEIRAAVAAGRDPLAERRKEKMPTFAEAAHEAHKALSVNWRNEKGKKVWVQRLEKHIFPRLGNKRVDEISRADVIAALSPVWGKKKETARKTRQYVAAVFRWCIANGYIENSPANADALSGALPKQRIMREHHRTIQWREFPEVLRAVDQSGGSHAVRLCFGFLCFTACRGYEARGATWAEISIEDRLWSIPANRMKTSRPWQQPLSDQAIKILTKARALHDGDLVFPNPATGREFSDAALMVVLKRAGVAERQSVHGVRSAFRDYAASHGFDRQVAELSLAHHIGGVEGAYFRDPLLDRRAALMAAWGDHLGGTTEREKVVSLFG